MQKLSVTEAQDLCELLEERSINKYDDRRAYVTAIGASI